jgi:hypothetical protein
MAGTFPRDETGAEIVLGDLVFWDGAVWKVTGIEQILGGYNLTLFNKISGYKDHIIPQSTTCLGADTLTGIEVLPPSEVKVEDDDDEDEEEDRPPQSIIVAPTAGPLFPEFVFKPGDKVFRALKGRRGPYWREGLVKAVVAGKCVSDDKVVVEYTDGNGCHKTGLWPIRELRRERPHELRETSDLSFGVDRTRGLSWIPRGYTVLDDCQTRGPAKTDSISRADLISREARRLANEDRRASVLGKDKKEDPKPGNGGPKIKTRKGEW